MLRQKGYTLINILGLAVGMATSILVIRYIQDEFSYNAWHAKGDRIYRVVRETRSGGESVYSSGTSGALAAVVEQDFPEVERAVRVARDYANTRYGEDRFGLALCVADTAMFNVFDYPFSIGSYQTAFPSPNSIVLSRTTAERIFGEENPIGKTLSLTSSSVNGEFVVTATHEDIPANATLKFNAIITRPTEKLALVTWNDGLPTYTFRPVTTYVLLKTEADLHVLKAKLSSTIDRYMGPEVRKNNDYHLQPFYDIHLYSNRDYGMRGGQGDIDRVHQFGAIALVVLAIACINFTNLTTARSARRAGEVGLRKVTGAHRSQLVAQFLGESIVTAFFSLLLAVVLVKLVITDFNTFFQKQLTLDLSDDPTLTVLLLGITIFVGLMAGAYPSLFLSAFQPGETLKGTFRSGSKGHFLRKALVVLQFAISIVLIAGTGVIYQQMEFLKSKDLGFDSEQVVDMPIYQTDRNVPEENARMTDRYSVVKQAFLAHPNALEASAYRWGIGWGGGMMRSVQPQGHDGTDWRMRVLEVDEDYLEFFKIDMVSGRKFDPIRFPADTSNAFILNQTAVDLLGWEAGESGEKIRHECHSNGWITSETESDT